MKTQLQSCRRFAGPLGVMLLTLACRAFLPQESLAAPLQIHVSLSGNDSAAGTVGSPVKSLAKAQALVREARKQSAPPPEIEVLLAGGEYVLAQPLAFAPEDGDEHTVVTYRSEENQWAVLSGARPISFTAGADGNWQATLPEPPGQFFANNSSRPTAGTKLLAGAEFRWPTYPDKHGTPALAVAEVSGVDPALCADLHGARLSWLDDWRETRLKIQRGELAGFPIKKLSLTFEGEDVALAFRAHGVRQPPKSLRGSHFENVRSAMSPGEWFYDDADKRLEYKPAANEKIESLRCEYPALTHLVTIKGREGQPVRNLRFTHLGFTKCSSIPSPGSPFFPLQAAAYWTDMPPVGKEGNFDDRNVPLYLQVISAAVSMERAEHISFDDNFVARVSGAGIAASEACKEIRIEGNLFSSTGAEAIIIGSPYHPAVSTNPRPCDGVTISGNVIRKAGRNFAGSAGITAFYTSRTTISQNDLADLPYTAISVGWGWRIHPDFVENRENKIIGNRIVDVTEVAQDGGGIYTLGPQPDSVIEKNYIANINAVHCYAIYNDSGSSAFAIRDNVGENVSVWLAMHQPGANTISGNYATNAKQVLVEASSPVENFNLLPPDHWPAEAEAIKAGAGVPADKLTDAQKLLKKLSE